MVNTHFNTPISKSAIYLFYEMNIASRILLYEKYLACTVTPGFEIVPLKLYFEYAPLFLH